MSLRSSLDRVLGKVSERLYAKRCAYNSQLVSQQLGGVNQTIQYPFHITGLQNIVADDNINIGRDALIMTSRAKLYIKSHFVSGPGLTIITGDHMPLVGRFIDTITNEDKDKYDTEHRFDQDVTIEEDVWCGSNVTILKGVTIGRGAIIASGAIVTKNIPPYCIAGGIPAKPLKLRWGKDEIIEHETKLYSPEKKLSPITIERLVRIFYDGKQ